MLHKVRDMNLAIVSIIAITPEIKNRVLVDNILDNAPCKGYFVVRTVAVRYTIDATIRYNKPLIPAVPERSVSYEQHCLRVIDAKVLSYISFDILRYSTGKAVAVVQLAFILPNIHTEHIHHRNTLHPRAAVGADLGSIVQLFPTFLAKHNITLFLCYNFCPHISQKLLPASFSCPHLGHFNELVSLPDAVIYLSAGTVASNSSFHVVGLTPLYFLLNSSSPFVRYRMPSIRAMIDGT